MFYYLFKESEHITSLSEVRYSQHSFSYSFIRYTTDILTFPLSIAQTGQ